MKMTGLLIAFMSVALALAGCALYEPAESVGGEQSVLGDVPARFQGQLPCADCAGIRYELSLYADHVYALKRTYLGTPDQNAYFFEQGKWTLHNDTRTLILATSGNDKTANWHVPDQDTIKKLTADSDLDYSLQRTGEPVDTSLINTYWRLISLNGETLNREDLAKEPHFVLHENESRVAGTSGCNRLAGEYSRDGNKLRFSKLAGTRMACPGPSMKVEQAFTTTLGNVRSYRILADHLAVYDGNGKQVALFRATALQ